MQLPECPYEAWAALCQRDPTLNDRTEAFCDGDFGALQFEERMAFYLLRHALTNPAIPQPDWMTEFDAEVEPLPLEVEAEVEASEVVARAPEPMPAEALPAAEDVAAMDEADDTTGVAGVRCPEPSDEPVDLQVVMAQIAECLTGESVDLNRCSTRQLWAIVWTCLALAIVETWVQLLDVLLPRDGSADGERTWLFGDEVGRPVADVALLMPGQTGSVVLVSAGLLLLCDALGGRGPPLLGPDAGHGLPVSCVV